MGLRLTLALLVGAAGFSFIAYTEYNTYSTTKAEPNSLTMTELVADGFGDNANVVLTEFALSDEGVLSTGDKRNAYIPATTMLDAVTKVMDEAKSDEETGELIFEADFTYSPKTFPLIVCLNDITDAEMEAYWNAESLEGIILTGYGSLSSDTRNELRTRFPQADFDNIMALHVGKERPSLNAILALVGGAVICLLIGLSPIIRMIGERRSQSQVHSSGFEQPTPME